MILGKYKISLNNIHAFIQGNYRVLVENYGGDFIKLEPHIQEQVLYRTSLANPECLANGMCKCNCAIPALFYTDKKLCADACYPAMMTAEEWNNFKLNLNNISNELREQLHLPTQDDLLHGSNQQLGNFKAEGSIRRQLQIPNTLNKSATIISTSVSCGCTNLIV